MCSKSLQFNSFENEWRVNLRAFIDQERICEMMRDGLILDEDEKLSTTERERFFLRNIAAQLDLYPMKHELTRTFLQLV